LARRDAKSVRLYTRNGNDFTARFLLIVASVIALPARSCLIDGEAIVSDASGLAVFELIRSFRHDHAAVLCAFDLLELDGEDSPVAGRGPQSRACPAAAQVLARHRGQRPLRRRRQSPIQGQEPGGTGSAARGRGRMGTLTTAGAKANIAGLPL
jgi:hypothetical protein